MNPFRPALGACGAALIAASCVPRPPSPAIAPSLGPYLRKASEVGADVPLQGPAILELDGEAMDVELKSTKTGNDLALTILLNGQENDREVYSTSDVAFTLKRAAGETYEPPIDLLRFPMHTGDAWTWSGFLGSEGLPAKAKVTTSPAKVAIPGGNVSAVETRVDLQISLRNASARRVLTFWFVEGRGVIQREFGNVSKRRPKTE